jgi:hypothetical protein
MAALLDRHVRTLLDAIAFAWPALGVGMRLHTPQPIPPVDDDDEDDDKPGGGSGGGNIDPDDEDGSDDDDGEDDDEDTLWTGRRVRSAEPRRKS